MKTKRYLSIGMAVIGLLACGVARSANGDLVVPTHEYIASEGVASSTWTDKAGTVDLGFRSVSGSTASTETTTASSVTSSYDEITHAYTFGGDVTLATSGQDWHALGADGESASYEVWLRPAALNNSDRQNFIGTGGAATGFSLSLDEDNTILALLKDNSGGASAEPALAMNSATALDTTSEFVQVVFTVDQSGSDAIFSLYVDGQQSGSPVTLTGNMAYDSAGQDGALAGIGYNPGNIGVRNAGGSVLDGGSTYDSDTFVDFSGDVAQARLYNQSLTETEVEDRYNSVIPEPSALALFAMGLAVLRFLRRFNYY